MVVLDNGHGIPENYQHTVFDMFYRANDRVQVSSLGLNILKRAVKRLNGIIELKSVLHEGSLFTVSLPC
ncbi:MAG: ATP-binding protein [Chryseotalea sp.]|nr:ATP-binding protein [Cytophagales bacterium]